MHGQRSIYLVMSWDDIENARHVRAIFTNIFLFEIYYLINYNYNFSLDNFNFSFIFLIMHGNELNYIIIFF